MGQVSVVQIADVYHGEFMQLFNHLYIRYFTSSQGQGGAGDSKFHLKSDAFWCKAYNDGSSEQEERVYFAGR